jgi:serine/threonine protein kinase/WD40 repeat protein
MFDEDRRTRLMEWFAEGVELDGEQRSAFVERVASEDPQLADELADLLQVQASGLDDFLAEPAVTRSSELGRVFDDSVAPGLEYDPPRIPGYRDMVLIGEGGMGAVFRAQQYEPVHRTVAIKVIRAGMDSAKVLQRFEAERGALARMAHPYIATVHDAGTDDQGLPFLVMEYVDGLPINEFCRTAELSLADRVELCAKICEAVDHAHRRGVLHRDLKPANVLVVRAERAATPKIIDFGIAKALEGYLTERTLLTEQGAFLGTPEYMSPEQVDGDQGSIDTRSDVYALGVMLYELLTGVLPFDSKRLREAGFARMVTILRDEVPPKPSTRLRDLPEGAEPAQVEAALSRRWVQRLEGDLDWVVMRALEKDPEQRYATPRDLADDLRRYLQSQPVLAGPPSGLYRMRRFARRYRIQVAAALLVLLTLIVGLSGTLWFLFESKNSEAEARLSAERAVASERLETGSRIAAKAALATLNDPNLALQLAIEASRYSDEYTVADAILGTLPTHDLLQAFALRDHSTRQVQFLPDGRLFVRTYDLVFWLVDPDSGAVLRRFDGHTDVVRMLDAAPELGVVLTASEDGTVRVWGIEDGVCRGVLEHGAGVRWVQFSADRQCFAAWSDDGLVRVYESDSLALRHEFGGFEPALASIDFHPLSPRLLLHTLDGASEIRNLGDGRVFQRVPPAVEGRLARWSVAQFGPGGDRIVRNSGDFPGVLGGKVRSLEVTNLAGEVLRELTDFNPMRGPLTDPLLAVNSGRVVSVSLQTGEIVDEVLSGRISFLLDRSLDRRTYIAIDGQLDLCLIDAESGKKVRGLTGRSDKRWDDLHVAFHPDGRRFAVTGRDVRIWALEPDYAPIKFPLHRPREADAYMTSMACGVDGALAVLREGEGEDRCWSLWDVDLQSELRTLRPGGVEALMVSDCATKLIGSESLPAESGQPARMRYVVLDLEGKLLFERIVPAGTQGKGGTVVHPNGTEVAVIDTSGPGRQRIRIMDMETGALGVDFETESSVFQFNRAPGHPFAATSFGDLTRTDFYDLSTGGMVRSIRGPAGASQYYQAVDPENRRMLVVLGDLRVRTFNLDGSSEVPTGEYSRLVRSNQYGAGFVPGTELAWAKCANEVHLFHAVTCRPFAVLRMEEKIDFVAARPDGSEILTATTDGWAQRWSLEPVAVAQRKVVGALDERTLEHFNIGTVEERDAHERARLLASPSPRNYALLGERALSDGDLDRAIDFYWRACDQGLLGKADRRRYVQLLDLLCRRLAVPPAEPVAAEAAAEATEALKQCLRCEVPLDELVSLRGFDRLRALPGVQRLLEGVVE